MGAFHIVASLCRWWLGGTPPTAMEKTEVYETSFKKISNTEVQGFIKQKNGYISNYTVYFVLQLNKQFETADAWQSEPYRDSANSYGTLWR